MSVDAFSAALQAATQALASAIVNPADALRLFSNLAAFAPAAPVPMSQTGVAMGAAQTAVGALARRAAIAELAMAASAYQPSSYDDANSVRAAVCAVIDAEITIAGDDAEDNTYQALRALRQAVVQDLTVRGADLAPMKAFRLNAPLPALALAWRFYQDASRGDQLYVQSGARHPAFLPAAFTALSR